MLIDRIASDEVLEAAYQWLCEKRAHYHFNGDVWQLRRWWTEKKAYVQKLLLDGQYQFRELRLIRREFDRIRKQQEGELVILLALNPEMVCLADRNKQLSQPSD